MKARNKKGNSTIISRIDLKDIMALDMKYFIHSYVNSFINEWINSFLVYHSISYLLLS